MWKSQLDWVIESFVIQLCLGSNCSQSIVLHFMRAADNVVQTFISILFKDASPKSAWLLCLDYLPFIGSIFFSQLFTSETFTIPWKMICVTASSLTVATSYVLSSLSLNYPAFTKSPLRKSTTNDAKKSLFHVIIFV